MTTPDTDTPARAQDARVRAFDWLIAEVWYWINNDYAHKVGTDRADSRAIDDTWIEIAARLEKWRDEATPAAPAGDGD